MNTIKKSWPVFVLALAVFCGALVGSARATYNPSWVTTSGVPNNPGFMFGDASTDGTTVTFDGSTTILGLAPASSVYTMTADLFCNNVTVNSGVTIVTKGFFLLCTGTLTNNGTISCNGGNASGATGGTATNNLASEINGTANSGATGTTGAASQTAGQTVAGIAGCSGGGGQSGGTAGTTAASVSRPALQYLVRTGQLFSLASPLTYTASSTSYNTGCMIQSPNAGASNGSSFVFCGGGGGKGSGDGTNAGGGGGAGGGSVFVYAKTITVGASGTFAANGGNGGNGAAGTAGGGGGGGGGVIRLVANSYTGTALVSGTNVTAAAGTHGNGSTTAGNGGDGAIGAVFILTNQ